MGKLRPLGPRSHNQAISELNFKSKKNKIPEGENSLSPPPPPPPPKKLELPDVQTVLHGNQTFWKQNATC